MDEAFRIVIPNEVRNLVFSEIDCHVAPLLAMTVLKESLNLGTNQRKQCDKLYCRPMSRRRTYGFHERAISCYP
jgi:hypothetical protein